MVKLFGKKDEFESNNFRKYIKKDRKIVIDLFNKETNEHKTFEYEFETNKVQSIPETDIIFAIAMEKDDNNFVSFFNNIDYNWEKKECDSPTRTAFLGLTEKYGFFRYMFNYGDGHKLKIDSKGKYYVEVSIEFIK